MSFNQNVSLPTEEPTVGVWEENTGGILICQYLSMGKSIIPGDSFNDPSSICKCSAYQHSKDTRRCREVRGKRMSSSSYRGKWQADEGDLNAHGPKAHFMPVVIKRLTLNFSGVKFYTFADTPLRKLILLNFTVR